jgi:hypothetical protein
MTHVRLSHALLTVLIAAGWPALTAHAQEGYGYEGVYSGVLTAGPTVSHDEARGVCLEIGGPFAREAAEGEPEAEVSCHVEDSGELERAGDRRFFWASYAWTTLAPRDDADPYEGVREKQTVLFSAPLDGERLTAEWAARYEVELTASVTVTLGPTQDDGALLGVLSCVNGTGGCEQTFLLRDARGWRPVRQAWLEQLPDTLGGEFWKGTYTSPLTLQGDAGLYSSNDGNCCPSRILYYRLRLEGDALVLRDHHVVRLPEY